MSSINQTRRILEDDMFLLNIRRGLIDGMSLVYINGVNEDVDVISTPEDLWGGTGVYTGQPIHSAVAETVSLTSDSADDAAGGIGATFITIEGIGDDWSWQTENIPMSGLAPAVSTKLFRRVFMSYVLTAGSSEANVGTIIGSNTTTTGNVFFRIIPGMNQSVVAAYTVPLGKTLYLIDLSTHHVRKNAGDGWTRFTVRARGEGGVFRALRLDALSNSADLRQSGVFSLPEKTDIKIRVEETSDNDTIVSGSLMGILIDN